MIFYSAAEWYFYEGLREGVGGSLEALSEDYMRVPMFNSEVSMACCEAYEWGYMFGMELSKREYGYLMKPRIRLRSKPPVKKEEKKSNLPQVIEEPTDKEEDDIVWNKGANNVF